MKRATLIREESTDEGTFGFLALEGGPTLRTTELPWRDNATGKSCIPPGVYRCSMVDSPRFGRTYGVQDVPGRSHVLIHSANFGGDTEQGWHTELQGCIAPAMSVGVLSNPAGQVQRAGIGSKKAMQALIAWSARLTFELEIR